MGSKARSAIPVLILALSDGQEKVRMAVTNALEHIDPEAGAKAGVK